MRYKWLLLALVLLPLVNAYTVYYVRLYPYLVPDDEFKSLPDCIITKRGIFVNGTLYYLSKSANVAIKVSKDSIYTYLDGTENATDYAITYSPEGYILVYAISPSEGYIATFKLDPDTLDVISYGFSYPAGIVPISITTTADGHYFLVAYSKTATDLTIQVLTDFGGGTETTYSCTNLTSISAIAQSAASLEANHVVGAYTYTYSCDGGQYSYAAITRVSTSGVSVIRKVQTSGLSSQMATAGCPGINTALGAIDSNVFILYKDASGSVYTRILYLTSPVDGGLCIDDTVGVFHSPNMYYYGDHISQFDQEIPLPSQYIHLNPLREANREVGYEVLYNTNDGTCYYRVIDDMYAYYDPGKVTLNPGESATVQFNVKAPGTVTVVTDTPTWATISPNPPVPNSQATITVSDTAPQGEVGLIETNVQYDYLGLKTYEYSTGVIVEVNNVNDPPSIPVLHDVQDTTETTVTLSWDPSTDPEGDPITYEVKVIDTSTSTVVVDENITDTEYNFTGVAGKTYEWTVRACDPYSCSLWAESDTFTIQKLIEAYLRAPIDGAYYKTSTIPYFVEFRTNLATSGIVTIQYSTDGTTWNDLETVDALGTEGYVSGTITLSDGSYFIRAVYSAGGDSVETEAASITVSTAIVYTLQITDPADGSTFEAPPDGTVSVQITAYFDTSPYTGVRTYQIIATGTGGTQTVASVSSSDMQYTLTGIGTFAKGTYQIYPAVDIEGRLIVGDPITITVQESTTPNNPPSTPVLIDEPDTTDINVTLEWQASTDPEGDPITYLVQVARDAAFQDIAFTGETSDTSITATNLYGGYTYYWRVKACDDKNACSAWSNPDSFIVYNTTAVEIVEPPNNSSYVVGSDGTASVPITVTYTSNTNHPFTLVIAYNDGNTTTTIHEENLSAPFDGNVQLTYSFTEGNYVIIATLIDTDTNDTYTETSLIHVYPAGTELPTATLIDPKDGYFEEIPVGETTTITTRAEYSFVQDGNHYIAIEYKLRWAATWQTIVSDTVDVAAGETRSLTGNVTLGEGIYYFRAKVIDPSGNVVYSDTHTVYIRTTTVGGGGGEEEEGGGGGGGGGGGAAFIVKTESVEVNLPAGGEADFNIVVQSTSSTPISLKIKYEGDLEDIVKYPKPGSQVTLKFGENTIRVLLNGEGLSPGQVIEGNVILAPTSGSVVKIPVEVTVVEGKGPGVAPPPNIYIILAALAGLVIAAYVLLGGAVI